MMPADPAGWHVGLATRTDAAAVAALRRAAYCEAPEFAWNDLATLDWGPADDAAAVLVLRDADGALLSTLRATVLATRAQAADFLEYALDGLPLALPTLVLSRAATWPARASQGLAAHLRRAYLAALPLTPVASVSCIVYEGGPRLRSMQRTGYGFHIPPRGWDSEAVARARPLLAVLPRERCATALARTADELATRAESSTFDAAAIAGALQVACPA